MAEATEEINPIQKLIMEGFCSPRKMKMPAPYDDEDDDDNSNDKYAPDLTPQKAPKVEKEEPVTIAKEVTFEAKLESTTEATETKSDDESAPELDSSKTLIANRRKRGVENFIMACIFLLTTLLTLKKLGFTTPDFDLTVAREAATNGSLSWIHVFDKSSVEDADPEEPSDVEEATVVVDETTFTEETTEEEEAVVEAARTIEEDSPDAAATEL